MQRISTIILQSSVALGVVTVALPSVNLLQERESCLASAQAPTRGQVVSGTVGKKSVRQAAEEKMLADIDALPVAPGVCHDMSDVWLYSILAAMVFLASFVGAHICLLLARAYNKAMQKLV